MDQSFLSNISQKLKKDQQLDLTAKEVGRVEAVEDVIAIVSGLPEVSYGEVVTLGENIEGMVLDVLEDTVGVIVLGDATKIKQGDKVTASGKQLSIQASEELLGRHVNPLGIAKDGKSLDEKKGEAMRLERPAYGVIERAPVSEPLHTGIKAVDAMIPVGRGQRELVIGDRQTGKTAVALDTIINQEDVICVYVSVGQKANALARSIQKLQEKDAMKHTIVVSALASEAASLQYLAPYAGVAIAEYFLQKGKDVLIVYDDLTKHAWAYRALSLLLRRPPGREAYPGDIFYLHSRLLERAVKLSDEHGGGSITALPIIETQDGDVSAYIPTNVISITDGQIYLDSDMFNSGIKPAINVGTSVSRVGGAAQTAAMKKIAGKLRLELAQARALAAFAQFGSDLDKATQQKLRRGDVLQEILKQDQYEPVPIAIQIAIIFAATRGYLDDKPINEIVPWMKNMAQKLPVSHQELLDQINKVKKITDEIEAELHEVIKRYV